MYIILAIFYSTYTYEYMHTNHRHRSIRTFTEEDTRYKKHCTPQSPPKLAPWDLTQFSQSPSASLSYSLNLNDGLTSLPFKGDFSFGKVQKSLCVESGL